MAINHSRTSSPVTTEPSSKQPISVYRNAMTISTTHEPSALQDLSPRDDGAICQLTHQSAQKRIAIIITQEPSATSGPYPRDDGVTCPAQQSEPKRISSNCWWETPTETRLHDLFTRDDSAPGASKNRGAANSAKRWGRKTNAQPLMRTLQGLPGGNWSRSMWGRPD